MRRTLPGEVWRIDFGIAAKVRPALILSEFPRDNELALIIVVPHTTALRGNRWEYRLPKPFLSEGAFHLQQVQPIPVCRLDAKLGQLTPASIKRESQASIHTPIAPAPPSTPLHHFARNHFDGNPIANRIHAR